ncbi:MULTISPECIES: CsbD family protein [Sphingomonas]|uniref:CsbD family protein n=1 Tax=Sphingomonas TaxID=13687 RepID=UPI000DEF1177|nr:MULTISPECIES: CsbD family protein [Sphingomonas]
MNIDTAIGTGTDLKGQLKQNIGEATNDPALQQDGTLDQISGQARKGFGAVRDFAKRQPVAAAVAGALGLAFISKLLGHPLAPGRNGR